MDNVIEALKNLLTLDVPRQAPKSSRTRVTKEVKRAYNAPPRIAVIGTTGVGKSSTINALFSPDPPLPVGDVIATTRNAQALKVNLADRGPLVVIDYPGLNESIEANKRILPVYKKLLATCDAAVYVFQATDRTFADDQELLLRILTEPLKDRLVIGINQVDLIAPGNWVDEYNLPSVEQDQNIEIKVKDVKSKLKKIGLNPRFIVPYSATRGYRTLHLFKCMLEICPKDRVWVLSSREKVKSWSSPRLSKNRV